MASRTVVELIDDLTGEQIEDGNGETVLFSFRGKSYAVDLSEVSSKQFTDDMQRWIDVARPGNPSLGSTLRRRRSNPDGAMNQRDEDKRIRQWATENGVTVSARGRIAGTVREAYYAA